MPSRGLIVKIVCFIFVFIAIILVLWTIAYPSKLIINGQMYNVEVVDNKALLEKGLSGHAPLGERQGMLFVFQKPDNYGFWMKDMSFPIDIVWMDQNFKIVHIEKSVSPASYLENPPKIFYPTTPSLYVLEIPAGQANLFNMKIGDTADFRKKGL